MIGQTPAYPKRREDLRISDQKLAGETIFIVVDEKTGSYYSFAGIEFSIFQNLDGETPLERVKEKVEALTPGIEIPLEFLAAFVDSLKAQHLLQGEAAIKPGRGGWRSLFYLRVASFNPERLLEKLLSPFSFVFRPPFVLAALALIAWSLGFSVLHESEWLAEIRAAFNGWGLLTAYLSFLLVAFVHETGHALTCRFYGGRVKEMGFMLLYFEPAFYANVTDAYVFPDKKQRMYVGLAGLYFQFMLGVLATVVWYFSIPESLVSLVCVEIMGVNLFTAFWNLNPLIKLDGYYVLLDYLEVVNLRAHAFEYFGLLAQKFILGLSDAREKLKTIPLRLRKIYFWYGALGMGYTTFFLLLILAYTVRWVARKFGGSGLLLLAGGIAWGGWNWYKSVAPGLSKFALQVKENFDLQMVLKSRGKKIAFALGILFLIGLIPTRWGIKGACVVRPAVQRVLSPLESGVIVSVQKKEGDAIRKGEIFARLDDFEVRRDLASLLIEERLEEQRLAYLKAQYGSNLVRASRNFHAASLALKSHLLLSSDRVSQARNKMEEARARFRKAGTVYRHLRHDREEMESGSGPPEIAQVQEDLNKALSRLDLAKKEWERYQRLGSEKLVSQRKVEEKKVDWETAASEVAGLKDKLRSARQGLIRSEQVAYHDYVAAMRSYGAWENAYAELAKKSTVIEPVLLREEVGSSRKNLAFAKDEEAEVKEAADTLARVRAAIATDREKLARLFIRSPINGIIMTPHVKELQGRLVKKGEPVAWVYEQGPMIFEIKVDELDVPEIPRQNGPSSVQVRLLALPGRAFAGKVTRVVPASLAASGGHAYLVDVEIETGTADLLPGMEGTGKIYGRMHPLLWQLLRRPVKYIFWKLWGLF